MNLAQYSDFFHDGVIFSIQHIQNEIIISMASAELDEDHICDDVKLSKDDSIQGKLHIVKIFSVFINKKLFSMQLNLLGAHGKIFDFSFSDHCIKLSVDWSNVVQQEVINDFFTIIEIHAQNIYWENIPDLYFNQGFL